MLKPYEILTYPTAIFKSWSYITLDVGEEKPCQKNFYKFKKHETGWRFLANLHNKYRFGSRKKLSRKQHKTYTKSFLSIYQVNDDIIEIQKNPNFRFYGHFSSHLVKFEDWSLRNASKFW